MNKISYNGLKKVLSTKEMKNVVGGSGDGSPVCHCLDGGTHDADDCEYATCLGLCGENNVQSCAYTNQG